MEPEPTWSVTTLAPQRNLAPPDLQHYGCLRARFLVFKFLSLGIVSPCTVSFVSGSSDQGQNGGSRRKLAGLRESLKPVIKFSIFSKFQYKTCSRILNKFSRRGFCLLSIFIARKLGWLRHSLLQISQNSKFELNYFEFR